MKSQHTTPDLRPTGLALSGAGALSAYAIWLNGAGGALHLGVICGMSGASLGHCAVCYVSALAIAAGLALMALGAPRRRAAAR
jgi:2-keto-3-deoxy-galactonokinase